MSGSTTSSYTFLPVNQAQQPLLPGTRVVVVDEGRKRKRCMGVSGCCLLLLLGMLLFFLIPRRPRVRYEYSVFNVDMSAQTTAVTLTQYFSYFNPNFYGLKWKNLHVDVKDQTSGILIGYGTHNDTFHVSALETTTVSVDIDIVASASQLSHVILSECNQQGHVTFISTGTVDASIWSQELGTINVGPFVEIIFCSS